MVRRWSEKYLDWSGEFQSFPLYTNFTIYIYLFSESTLPPAGEKKIYSPSSHIFFLLPRTYVTKTLLFRRFIYTLFIKNFPPLSELWNNAYVLRPVLCFNSACPLERLKSWAHSTTVATLLHRLKGTVPRDYQPLFVGSTDSTYLGAYEQDKTVSQTFLIYRDCKVWSQQVNIVSKVHFDYEGETFFVIFKCVK